MSALSQVWWVQYLLLFWLSLDVLLAIQVSGPPGGVDPKTGARPFRYEISDFQHSGAAFDLYILAMSDFQGVNQSDPLSYFQISGIHGFPQVAWDGVSGAGTYPGFCMHAATPFATWHRPYLALFEVALCSKPASRSWAPANSRQQVLWTHAQGIAEAYPDDQRPRYRAAALALRIPYWDWAIHPELPDVVTEPLVTVNTPVGTRTIENPLYQYVFQSDAAGNGFPSTDPVGLFSTSPRKRLNLL
ncbi:uncharacterized protein A1O9_04314 [Exophiala aquamarina CBS 119918]|uniref:Tyrosinase copper-binding domain-containing protein n=1 Tax=Exophiala aquamarina CBS 119918 TaxID=1182545 RepID=A0A072PV79_9EURO|nr:uncharacterized protein A1O9_04314 [Exophiala aquamarina CBS 119918]KEF59470.1 hypothetical protein A1O9_04314 [Exophiala aquamarina CBS 119918]